jgi:hypothetical protein
MFRYQLFRPSEGVKKGLKYDEIDPTYAGLGSPAEVKARLAAAFPAAQWRVGDTGTSIADDGPLKILFEVEGDGQVRTVMLGDAEENQVATAARALKVVVSDTDSEDMTLKVY